MNINNLKKLELVEFAKKLNIKKYSGYNKRDLKNYIINHDNYIYNNLNLINDTNDKLVFSNDILHIIFSYKDDIEYYTNKLKNKFKQLLKFYQYNNNIYIKPFIRKLYNDYREDIEEYDNDCRNVYSMGIVYNILSDMSFRRTKKDIKKFGGLYQLLKDFKDEFDINDWFDETQYGIEIYLLRMKILRLTEGLLELSNSMYDIINELVYNNININMLLE